MKNTPTRITIRIIVGVGLLLSGGAHAYAQGTAGQHESKQAESAQEPIEVVRARLELAEAVAQAQGALAGLKQQEDALLAAQVRYQQAAEAVEQAKERAEKARVQLEALTAGAGAP